MPRRIDSIVVHHSASKWGDVNEINKWHKERGFSKIGYHFVVLNGFATYSSYKNNVIVESDIGRIQIGRDIDDDLFMEADEVGAHVFGYNSHAIGICLIHDKGQVYNSRMLNSAFHNIACLANYFDVPIENIRGHYEVDKKKPECPGLNMETWRKVIQQTTYSLMDVSMSYCAKQLLIRPTDVV